MNAYIFPGLQEKYQSMFMTGVLFGEDEQIIRACCLAFGISRSQIVSKSRIRDYADARCIAYKLIYTLSKKTLQQTGNIFNTDHATVIHGIKKFNNLIETDPYFKCMYERVKASLK